MGYDPKMNTRVSVVIPLFNKSPYITRAIHSILAQTCQEFEVIVIDDGSTDDGAELVREFCDPRIHLIQQENRGVSAARNRGVESARADLVAFLDADDEWLPEFLETIMALEKKYPIAGAFATGIVKMRNCREIHPYYFGIPDYPWDGLIDNYFRACFFGNSLILSSSVAIKKKVLESLSGFKEGVFWGEDQDLWGRIALEYPIAFNNKTCSRTYRYSTGEMYNQRVSKTRIHPFIQRIDSMLSCDVFIKKQDGFFFLYIDSLRIANAQNHLVAGNLKAARDVIMRSNTSYSILVKMYIIYLYLFPETFIAHFNTFFNIGGVFMIFFTNSLKPVILGIDKMKAFATLVSSGLTI